MLPSKEYYSSLLHFLVDACRNTCTDFTYEEGVEIAGNDWLMICNDLQNRGLARLNYGSLRIFQCPPLIPVMVECQTSIDRIKAEEHDRHLANKERLANIKYGKKGYRLSIVAIIISLIALGTEIGLKLGGL